MPGCSQYCSSQVRKPICASVLAPYVSITAANGDTTITVGNESAPNFNNNAVIKSFQYGHDDGAGVLIEIFDVDGGPFTQFAQTIVTDQTSVQTSQIQVKWGWIVANCDGSSSTILTQRTHTFIIVWVNIDFAAGGTGSGYIFKIEGQDLIGITFEARQNQVQGKDLPNQSVELKQAITQLCKQAKPKPIMNVKFIASPNGGGGGNCDPFDGGNFCAQQQPLNAANGNQAEFDFQLNGQTPKFKWDGAGETLVGAIRYWMSSFTTTNGKGVLVLWDETQDGGTLVFQESPFPKCGFSDKSNQNIQLQSIGTYIVNGGELSPVISFSPQIRWPFHGMGFAGAAFHPEGGFAQAQGAAGCAEDQAKQAIAAGIGTNTNKPVPDAAAAIGASAAQAVANNVVHEKAQLQQAPIEAELVIQGDPNLDNPIALRTQSVGIIVLNPFSIKSSGGVGCPEWTLVATSPCQSCLSSPQWIIAGVAHSIKDGSYTTTLKVKLPNPCPSS